MYCPDRVCHGSVQLHELQVKRKNLSIGIKCYSSAMTQNLNPSNRKMRKNPQKN